MGKGDLRDVEGDFQLLLKVAQPHVWTPQSFRVLCTMDCCRKLGAEGECARDRKGDGLTFAGKEGSSWKAWNQRVSRRLRAN